MIAQKGDGGELIVLGTGQRESRGVKRGYIADMDATEVAVREAVEQAERIAGFNIENVWAGFSSGGLVSDEAFIEAELGGMRIEQADLDALLQEGRKSIDPQGRMVLHAQPALYTLDGLTGVKKPLGLHADRLGVHIHVIAADGSPVRNLDLCVRSAHLEVKSIIASPVATGLACLTEEERDLGVALVEVGAGITNVSLFAGAMLVGLKSIPFGAADVTDDRYFAREGERFRVRDEVRALDAAGPGWDDLPALDLTRRVLEESMRLYPPAYAVPRTATEDVEVGGYVIPAGADVVIWIHHVHRDGRWFEDPERFDPDRFLSERKKALPQCAYLPFGAGQRACIGKQFAMMEAQLILARVLRAWRFDPDPAHVVRPRLAVTMSPRGGLPVFLREADIS